MVSDKLSSIYNYYIKDQMNLNLKSNFLQKKKQEKKKVEQKQQDRTNLSKLQKNIRAFLLRRKLQKQSLIQNNLRFAILLHVDVSAFPHQSIHNFVADTLQKSQKQRASQLLNIILACMKTKNQSLLELTFQIIKANQYLLDLLVKNRNFIDLLVGFLQDQKAGKIFQNCFKLISNSDKIQKFNTSLLLNLATKQFSNCYIETEGPSNFTFSFHMTLQILNIIGKRKKSSSQLDFVHFSSISKILEKLLNKIGKGEVHLEQYQSAFIYLLQGFKQLLFKMRELTIKELIDKNSHLMKLVEDEEQLEYFQNKMRQQVEFQQFCDQTLKYIEIVFEKRKALQILMKSSPQVQATLSNLISDINNFYEPKKILFVYLFLSEENNLKAMSRQKNPEFYVALKMRLMTMDDEEFVKSKIFTLDQWKNIIQSSTSAAHYLVKKMLMAESLKNRSKVSLIPFANKNEDESLFETLIAVLTNLYKKCLRTHYMSTNIFIDKQLDLMFNKFTFGMGARAIEIMLKNFPFAFRFESRMSKFQQFIKADKKNHDRSLFQQEEIDDDLIITVRRGYEFLDAYSDCMNKDLRKKYKIVFYNEQGMEEEGVDGGGIIKQFINRVLKSAFSDVFGMFYETKQNQILPNPSCNLNQQYEFIGKLIGKAVYEGINIEQKFAEPFLNLVIGRKNGLEELQFIDKQIYQSMIDLKRMNGKDIGEMCQTFTILDHLPNGVKNYVNLRNLNGQKNQQVLVTNENKMEFIMSYADYKCNKQLEEKTRLFRRGFLRVMKSQWLTMFSNQELNQIISGGQPDFSVLQLSRHVVYHEYTGKSQTIEDLWAVLSDFTAEQKSLFLLYVTSCSRPPTLGFGAMKPLMCIQRSEQLNFLPTANTCMNILRLPDYKNKKNLKQKLIYAITSKAGFQFA